MSLNAGCSVDILASIWLDIAMKQVGVAELKNNLSRHLRAVEAGEVIEVTDHDRPIARLVPIEAKTKLVIRPPLRPFSEVRDRVYEPANWAVSSLDLLMEDRRKR
jgi:prevent-host-death family protein